MQNNIPVSKIGEFELISLLSKRVRTNGGVIKGIGDDAAVLTYSRDKFLLLTTDMIAEDVHFRRKMGAKAIGHKALGCNISDIAAMGGYPKAAVISLGIPNTLNLSFVEEMYKGIKGLARRFGIALVGGDIVKNKKIIVNIALLGEVSKKSLVLRSGAKNADQIFVTGNFGRSLRRGKHLSFTPRLKESGFLVKKFKLSSMIDVSDGLAADLGHILESSGVGAIIYEDLIPKAYKATIKEALYDGEDYELIFTLSQGQARSLKRIKKNKFHFSRIGEITSHNRGLTLCSRRGKKQKISSRGFTHF